MKPVVLLDVDGVLADFVTPYLAAIEDYIGVHYSPEDVDGWDIAKALKLTPEVQGVVERDYVCAPGFCASLPIYPGARMGVAKLREVADVYAVTAPFDSMYWHREREFWLTDRMGFDRSHIMFVNGRLKHLICGDVLVEDSAKTLRSWQEYQGLNGVLWETPHNVNDRENLYTTKSWDDAYAVCLSFL